MSQKEFWESANIWLSYEEKFGVYFFTHSVVMISHIHKKLTSEFLRLSHSKNLWRMESNRFANECLSGERIHHKQVRMYRPTCVIDEEMRNCISTTISDLQKYLTNEHNEDFMKLEYFPTNTGIFVKCVLHIWKKV